MDNNEGRDLELYEYENGLKAICWSCGKTFVKDKPCLKCKFYICPHCENCGCHLDEQSKHVARCVISTMVLNNLLPIK